MSVPGPAAVPVVFDVNVLVLAVAVLVVPRAVVVLRLRLGNKSRLLQSAECKGHRLEQVLRAQVARVSSPGTNWRRPTTQRR